MKLRPQWGRWDRANKDGTAYLAPRRLIGFWWDEFYCGSTVWLIVLWSVYVGVLLDREESQ